jgi:hypothetical protein
MARHSTQRAGKREWSHFCNLRIGSNPAVIGFVNKIVDLDDATYDPARPRVSIQSPQVPLVDSSVANQAAGSVSS